MKRLIGKSFSNDNVQNDLKLLPMKVVADPCDKPMICVRLQGEEKQFSPLEISSMILRKMRETAEAFVECTIKDAVISVPASFNDSQRLATVDAGNVAGLNVMRIINEPTAAAIAYGLDNMNDDGVGKKNFLIFDLGGGTLDVSIITMERGNYKVRATVGDAHLGGVDFDNKLIRHCIGELEKNWERKDINFNPKTLAKLRCSCEKAKETLSRVEETIIDMGYLLMDGNFEYEISRTRFEELNMDLFQRCIEFVEKCLVAANMYRSSIDDVVLIGGSTRIPKVQEMLREFFDGKELSMRINTDEAVACGAAIQAAILSGISDAPKLMVHHITTHSLGVEIAKQVLMIPRNSTIPITQEVILSADQIEFPIMVYEGEMTRIRDNSLLGTLALSNAISFDPYGIVRIAICFNIDENGIFTISGENRTAAGQKKIFMTPFTRDFMSIMSREEVEKMASEAEKLRSEESKYNQKLEAKDTLERLINHLSKIIANEDMSKQAKETKDAIRKITKWLQNASQIIGDEFVEQYKEHVNCLEQALGPAHADAVNFQSSSPTPCLSSTTGMMTNLDTSLVHLVSRVEKLRESTRDFVESPLFGLRPSLVGAPMMDLMESRENNPQVLRKKLDGQCKDHGNYLEKAPSLTVGIANSQRPLHNGKSMMTQIKDQASKFIPSLGPSHHKVDNHYQKSRRT